MNAIRIVYDKFARTISLSLAGSVSISHVLRIMEGKSIKLDFIEFKNINGKRNLRVKF